MISERQRTWLVITAAALVSVAMRLRMFWSPVSVDEGGYLAVARGWAHGEVLYRDVFVDRPQGLLLLFRFWDWMSGGSTASIRAMAMLFGIVLVVSTGIIARELAGERAARFTVLLCAVVSAAPVIEGYAANAELLSGAISAAGLAVGVLALSKHHRYLWFFSAGVLCGVALSLKQSGFDGAATLFTWLIIGALFCASERRTAVRAIAAIAVGMSTVVGAMIAHGVLTGWTRWWSAMVGYRLVEQSVFSQADWGNLLRTGRFAAVVLGASAILAAVGTQHATRRGFESLRAKLTPQAALLVAWLLFATLAFLAGGGFWRHYWLLLAAPVSALAGVGLASLPRLRRSALVLAVAPCLAITLWVYLGDQSQLGVRAADDHRSALDARVASWFNAHHERGEGLYALCSSAAVYADTHQDPQYPYLWLTEVRQGPEAQNRLVRYLSDAKHPPQYIAEYQDPTACDSSGRVGRILHADYRPVAIVGPTIIYERNTPGADRAITLTRTKLPNKLIGLRQLPARGTEKS